MQYIYDKEGVLTAAEFPEVAGFGVQIPANGIELDKELTPKIGYVWLWKNGEAVQVADNRGNYYSTQTGEPVEFNEFGKVPSTLTKKAPTSPYDKWDGKKWVTDEKVKSDALKNEALAQRDSLLSMASEKIAPLQDAVDLDMATDEEVASLKEWKKYRVLLNRIEQQTGFPDNIDWPVISQLAEISPA